MRKSTLYPLLLLCIPLIGNIFIDGFSWSFFDFIIMGSLILLFSSGINLVLLRQKSIQYRVSVIGVLVLIFLIIWAELAVGIWSQEFFISCSYCLLIFVKNISTSKKQKHRPYISKDGYQYFHKLLYDHSIFFLPFIFYKCIAY